MAKLSPMKKVLPIFLLLFVTISETQAQFTRYIVRFKNKGGTPYTFTAPSGYLSQRAIDRRTRYGIAIDSTDLPVSPSYIAQVAAVPNITVLNVSKWLNAVCIQTSSTAAMNTINGFSFVLNTEGLAAREGRGQGEQFLPGEDPMQSSTNRIEQLEADFYNYGASSFNEIALHNGQFLHNIGLRGQGMQIAMMDGGFFHYNTYPAFDTANLNGQILSTWDFVDRQASVSEDDSHGMSCLSTIVANIPGQFIGKAPKASFHLYRTEDVATEQRIEEFNWVCGAERADSSGADVISTSLGYYIQFTPPSVDHPNSDMDGNTTMPAIAGDLAAKKGLLVFASIGNDGGNPTATHFLSTPSDGDSVLAIGAVNTSGVVGNFSSYGPSADGQVKPDLSSVGVAARIQTSAGSIGSSNGTSFACPNMAGLGTILWQGFPEYNNMKIRAALWQASSRYTNPDNRVGYGIPNMKLAFGNLLTEYATSTSAVTGCRITVNWTTKDVETMKYEIERKAPGETVYTKVAEVNPQAGTLLAIRNYQFINDLTSGTTGVFSYRIRQILDTAVASFYAVYIDTTNITISSPCVVTATNNPNAAGELISVQPNPAHGSVATVVIETPYAVTNMSVEVYDAKGMLVARLQFSKATGRTTIDLDISRYAAGKYYINVKNSTKPIGVAELMKL